eukprot:11075246-Lingulodinium_polyedra.AAC.1
MDLPDESLYSKESWGKTAPMLATPYCAPPTVQGSEKQYPQQGFGPSHHAPMGVASDGPMSTQLGLDGPSL